jgi:hypothetical protein
VLRVEREVVEIAVAVPPDREMVKVRSEIRDGGS